MHSFVSRSEMPGIVTDVDSEEDSGSHSKKRSRGKTWSDLDNQKFFSALRTFGTDFMLMQSTVFPNRTRKELKLKFKREEKKNASNTEMALNNQMFNVDMLNKEFGLCHCPVFQLSMMNRFMNFLFPQTSSAKRQRRRISGRRNRPRGLNAVSIDITREHSRISLFSKRGGGGVSYVIDFCI